MEILFSNGFVNQARRSRISDLRLFWIKYIGGSRDFLHSHS